MTLKKEQLQEHAIYALVWGLLFLAPVLSLYVRTTIDNSQTFDWDEVLMVWRRLGVFLAVFLAHNHLLAPMLVYRQRRLPYLASAGVLIAVFTLYQCQHGPGGMNRHTPTHMTDAGRPPLPDFDGERPGPHDFSGERPTPPEFDGERPAPPEFDGERPAPRKFDGKRPPMIVGQHDIMNIVVVILMLAANLGIKLYFKQRSDQQQMAELEHRNLEQQLEYLKYQLNPHFLMNTLNNIHALVDIDPERAKEAVIQLSKILRYVLYESNHERVPLAKEAEFMDNYIQLMRMRYGDKLKVSVSTPEAGMGLTIPPLLFISFVENAFKHGVSYQRPSFIDIAADCYTDSHANTRLSWTCRNSKHPQPDDSTPRQGGVGMTNVRQRLDLIFGSDYTLDISDAADVYEVKLDIPLEG